MTLGEYYRLRGANFSLETFKLYVRRMKIPHIPETWPYKYNREDLDRVYVELSKRSLYLRAR